MKVTLSVLSLRLLHRESENSRTVVAITNPLGIKIGRNRFDNQSETWFLDRDSLVVLLHADFDFGDVDPWRLIFSSILCGAKSAGER